MLPFVLKCVGLCIFSASQQGVVTAFSSNTKNTLNAHRASILVPSSSRKQQARTPFGLLQNSLNNNDDDDDDDNNSNGNTKYKNKEKDEDKTTLDDLLDIHYRFVGLPILYKTITTWPKACMWVSFFSSWSLSRKSCCAWKSMVPIMFHFKRGSNQDSYFEWTKIIKGQHSLQKAI